MVMRSLIVRRHWSAVLALGVIIAMGTGMQLMAGAGSPQQKSAAPPPAPPPAAKAHAKPLSGDQVFMTNCSRCHMAPMSIPPRITGTVIMHMRVRARLSKEQQEALLKYLAP
jgi:cytochrome c5